MYILDTDTLTHLQKRTERAVENLRKHEDEGVAITIVTRSQILKGRIDFLFKAADKTQLERAQRLLIESEAFLAQWPILQFDEPALKNFEAFRQESKYRNKGRNDLLIASICLSRRETLVTRNTRDFEGFPNLKIVNWID